MTADRSGFLDELPFGPDPFQLRAFDALDAGRSVLVSAPTGSGKTLVATYAVDRALRAGTKAFYTTPLKALSNQKELELAARYGEARVGLLTGDVSRRPEAPVVVMTTEVLRNMLLTGSDLLHGLATVVLDEVHFLQDPYRGGVWEEVIVLAPPPVSFVYLSATASNAVEVGRWLVSVRGPLEVIEEEHRPITLRHHYAVRRRHAEAVEIGPLLDRRRQVSPEATAVDRRAANDGRPPRQAVQGRRDRSPPAPLRAPRRTELVETLSHEKLLPAIVFIFSRAACDDAVRQCVAGGVRLGRPQQGVAVREVADRHTEGLDDEELKVLGYPEWITGLEHGLAAHHAGLVPAFRETVEECFAAGLLEVVFATETLSLGINMPARTVAIERFSKFGPVGRAPLSSGDYLQLTGRAGRRGLDDEGHAVVLWSPELSLKEVADVATGRPPALRSSFRPTYNLVANLVRRHDRPQAIELVRRSFAQWQADHRAGRSGRPGGSTTDKPGGAAAPDEANARPPDNHLVDLFARRLAVLEELGHVRGWALTPSGERLSRIYHEADLVVAESIESCLERAEPSVVAGVLSALVFEPRRAVRAPRPLRRGGRPRPGGGRRRSGRPDRLGPRRRRDLDARLSDLAEIVERTRALEEVHRVPPCRRAEPGLGVAVVTWARGGDLGEAMAAAAEQGVELAPGDFVRIMKQLADLTGQVASVAEDPAVAAAARQAVGQLVRGVVAATGAPPADPSTTGSTPPS